MRDDLGRRFLDEGIDVVDGLVDRLERLLSDGSPDVERTREVLDGAGRAFSDHRRLFLKPGPEFLEFTLVVLDR
ncbi:hypothetical protein FCV25MIE_09136 [Fagus crenata]